MKKLYDLFFPPRCISCGTMTGGDGGALLCKHCMARWEFAKKRAADDCKGQPTRTYCGFEDDRLGRVMFSMFYEPGKYENVESRVLFSLKRRGGRQVVEFVSGELAAMIRNNLPDFENLRDSCVIAWLPRRRSSVRKYGFDHMERVAKRLAHELDMSCKGLLLRRLFTAEQHKLDGKARRANAYETIVPVRGADLRGKSVILVDDIVTTGASLEAAADMLIKCGASQVIAAVIASTQRSTDNEYVTDNGFNIIKSRKSQE